ncbi:MAG: hypothetical protein U9P72_12135, partial [Campylobacterota bacterium]|nr:hypothetical protein [Campylobacterota bacterium]
MIKINYANYLIDKDFDFISEYEKIFTNTFLINKDSKPRKEFKYKNGKKVFKDKNKVSLDEVFIKFKVKRIEEFNVIFMDYVLND